jgi:NADH:ubiquinone oxidoreductase subunit E
VGRVIVRVCDDIPCYINGSEAVLAACERHLGLKPGQTSADGRFTLEVHPCLGRCERAPFMLLNTTEVGPVNPAEIPQILEEAEHAG